MSLQESELKLRALQIAATGAADARTCMRWLRGEPVRLMTGHRIEQQARKLGVNREGGHDAEHSPLA